MVDTVTVTGAFAAGLVSFVSPCVLPLVPPYLAFVAGVGLDELKSSRGAARLRVAVAALCFVLGFSTVFVALGASASALGGLLRQYQQVLGIVAGLGILLMGLHFLGVFRLALLYREARIEARTHRAGPFAAYLMGLAFGFGWTPCIGPVLATILAVSASRDTVAEGAGLLAVYSAGLGVPFLIAAGFAGSFMRLLQRFRGLMGYFEKAVGLALVATGLMFLFGGIDRIAFWLVETFPVLGTIG